MDQNMLGAYGPWAAGLAGEGPGRWSFRNPQFAAGGVDAWRSGARERLKACLLQPGTGGVPQAEIQHQFAYDGLHIEHLSWQLPYGPPTEAVFLKPEGATGRLPAVLGLHDHGGNKYFGWRKIAQISNSVHPMMTAHRDLYYGGVSWANELAKRGFAVLVHDAFAFASRRVRAGDVPALIRKDLKEVNPESEAEIKAYNNFASEHEHLMAKSLFCAGTTWPGVFTAEDQRALDYLCSRPDVDAAHVGLRRPLGRRAADRLPGRPRRPHPLRLLHRDDDDVARLPAPQVLHAYLDDLHSGDRSRPRLSGDPRPAGAVARAGAEQHRGPAFHAGRNAPGRFDPGGGLLESGRRRSLPVLVLFWSAQV